MAAFGVLVKAWYGCFCKLGLQFVGVLNKEPYRDGFYMRTPDFGNSHIAHANRGATFKTTRISCISLKIQSFLSPQDMYEMREEHSLGS